MTSANTTMEEDDGNHAKKGKQEDSSADSSSSSISSSSGDNNNDTKILKVTESILSVCNTILSVSDLTPDEKGQVIRNITESSLFVASNNNNNSNDSKEAAAAPETSNSVSTSTSTAVQSDFAPFVGGVLTDRLVDEIGVLQSRLIESRLESENKRLVVQITGKNGTPIYFEGSLKNAERYGDDHIVLRFKNGSRDGFPLSSIEIRLGGVKVQQVNIDDITIYFYNDGYDEENRMQYIWLNLFSDRGPNISGPIVRMMDAKIGPLPLGWRQRHVVGDGIDMLLTNFLELVADENNDLTPQTLKIQALVFDEKTIPGLMSFVTKEMTESRLESEHKRLRVQITGVDGTPIYCDGSLKNAELFGVGEINLDFDYGSSDGFPLSSLNIEMRLGGVKVQQFNIDDLFISFMGLYDEENRMEYIHLNHNITPPPNGSGEVAQVHGRIGPLPLGWGRRNTDDEDGMVLTDFLELVADENNDLTPQTLIIDGLVFDEEAIPGLMSLIEK